MEDVKVELSFSGGAKQSLDFLSKIPRARMIGTNPVQKEHPIPLSSFSFSLSLGIKPSNGTMTASGRFVSDKILKTVSFEDAKIAVIGGEDIVFEKLKITDFSFSPLNAEPGGDRVYSLNFQDIRWRLEKGGVYGYFNRTLKIKDKQVFLDATVNPETNTPWTYLDLVKKVAVIAGVEIEKAPDTEAFQSGLTVSLSETTRLDEFPLNKEYNGESPADVLADILAEIDFTLTVNPEGEILLCTLAGTIDNPAIAETQPLQSSAGAKYKAIPDKVYMVGGRVRDQIRIEPNPKLIADLDHWSKASSIGKTGYETEELSFEDSDYGLLSVCPDITGKIRDFWDLLSTWVIDFGKASIVYNDNKGEGVWRGLIGEDVAGLLAVEQAYAKAELEYDTAVADYEEDPTPGNKYIVAEKKQAKDAAEEALIKEHNEGGDASERSANAAARLYPNEVKFLEDHPDFDALAEKVRIAQKYFFRLFQIPETVKVNYEWDDELAEVQERFAPEALSGEVSVPRSYVLPFKENIDEWQDIDEDEDEEGDEKQSDKGLSKSEQKKDFKIDFGVKGQKRKRRFRIWGYGYGKDSVGVYHFSRKEFKEIDSEVVNTQPELGLILFSKAPYMLTHYFGHTEDCPFIYKGCPIGMEFAYDRKDPRLGVLNYFVHKLKKPSTVKGLPPSRNEDIIAFEQIDEIIEYLLDGYPVITDIESFGTLTEALRDLADNYATEIWEKQAGTEASQTRSGVSAPIYAYPIGPLQAVSWRTDPFITLFEINTDYQAFNRGTLSNRINNALQAKKLYHRSETLDQKFLNQRGFWRLPDKERLLDDERRILINTPHFGSIVMYDPDEAEDVIAISAQLDDAASHHHKKFWLGPLLCREPKDSGFVTTLMTPETLYGHFWYAAGHDPCLLGNHSHAVGGFYYPYVYAKRDITGPPLDPIPSFEGEELFPGSVMLVNEGATASLYSAMKWIYDPTYSVKSAPEELIYLSNPYVPPKDADGSSFAAALIVEFCVGSVVAAPTSATFSLSYQLTNSDECFGTGLGGDPRTGSGTYVLNIPAGNAFEYHRVALFPIGVAGDFSYGFDALSVQVSRNYAATENLFAFPVYFYAAKLAFGWLETTPQLATFLP